MRNPMDLIERYLKEVRFWLPGRQREDVIRELGEDLRSEVEERETGLGRRLKEPEIAEILKRRGQPMIVAVRYLPIQHVVGPGLFPFYWTTLRASFIGLAVAHVVLAVVRGVQNANPFLGVLSAVPNFVSGSVYTIGLMTVVVVLLEHFQASRAKIGDWSPQSLPSVPDEARISRTCSAFEIFLRFCS